jgi:hypothetical protein
MIFQKRYIILNALIFAFGLTSIKAQSSKDTSKLVKEFVEVLSFFNKPNIVCSTYTKYSGSPILSIYDSLQFSGLYIKTPTQLFTNNGIEEILQQDSLNVTINHKFRSVWVSKVKSINKKQPTIQSLSKQMLESIRENSIVYKEKNSDGLNSIVIENKLRKDSISESNEKFIVQFNKNNQPTKLVFEANLKSLLTDILENDLMAKNLNPGDYLQTIDNQKYFVRKQIFEIEFTTIELSTLDKSQLPNINNKIRFIDNNEDVEALGAIAGYKIIKSF